MNTTKNAIYYIIESLEFFISLSKYIATSRVISHHIYLGSYIEQDQKHMLANQELNIYHLLCIKYIINCDSKKWYSMMLGNFSYIICSILNELKTE